MPELPDILVYQERIEERVKGAELLGVRLASPFVLRTVTPQPASLAGHTVQKVSRIGKRIVLELQGPNATEAFLVIHLMIAGRFRWSSDKGVKIPGKIGLAAFDFSTGTLLLTEASTKKRASIHAVATREELASFHRGGVDVRAVTASAFAKAMTVKRHTLKRALTDPTLIDGVGNAYSDEILHAAKLSPFRMTDALSKDEWKTLHAAARSVLESFTELFRKQPGFPEKVTAFREEMAVHGRYGKPCPVCGCKVQRIVYAQNEANYCAECQTGGRLLADRALSRLLKDDWPKTLEELEERRAKIAPKP